jgi:hypothetical protein
MDSSNVIEDVRLTLQEIVRAGLETRPNGVHLTYIGSEFIRRKRAPFEQYLTVLSINGDISIPVQDRKLTQFIEKHCKDILSISKNEKESLLISIKDENLEKSLLSNSEASPTSADYRFKKSVWAAFVRPLPEGFQRYLSLDNFGFTDAKEKPDGTWLEIEKLHINETPTTEAIDGPKTQALIQDWSSKNKISMKTLIEPARSKRNSQSDLDSLLGIIERLPSELAQRWLIPADVLKHLMV